MILIILAGFIFSGVMFSNELLHNNEKSHAYTFCRPTSYSDFKGKVEHGHYYVLDNTTDKEWHVTVTYKLCPQDTACIINKVENKVIPPLGNFDSGYSEYQTKVDFQKPGTYWFTTISEITGDVNSVQKETCSYTVVNK